MPNRRWKVESSRWSAHSSGRSATLTLSAAAFALALAGCGGGSTSSGGTVVQTPFQGITKIVIDNTTSEAVTFGGTSFGAVGQYQKIRGVAFGQLDPNNTKNG